MSMIGRIKKRTLISFLLLAVALIWTPDGTLAQSETPYDLIDTVNGLRAQHGLDPYQIDPWLMTYAQEHSEYQARNQTSTHRHSDGTRAWDIGLQENVASGDVGIVTVAVVVYKIWSDRGHRHVLIGYSNADVGAGVAFTGSDQVYYTLVIRPGEEAPTITSQPDTAVPFVPLVTSTPGQNGDILHIVRSGETLWQIALSYGVTVEDIRRLNGLAANSTFIAVGQKLLIRPAPALSATRSDETLSEAAQTPAGTAGTSNGTPAPVEPTRPPETGTIQSSPTATAQPADNPSEMTGSAHSAGLLILLAVCALALLTATIMGFWKAHVENTAGDRH
jgi:uncharacterized protein YkwD